MWREKSDFRLFLELEIEFVDINNTTGQVALSRLLRQVPGTIDAEFTQGGISGTIPTPDEFGNTNYDGGAED